MGGFVIAETKRARSARVVSSVYTYIYIYIYMYVCVCVSREKEREGGSTGRTRGGGNFENEKFLLGALLHIEI